MEPDREPWLERGVSPDQWGRAKELFQAAHEAYDTEGTNKVGVLVTGGNTYFGNIVLTNSTGVSQNGAGATIVVQGDSSSAFRMTSNSKRCSCLFICKRPI